MFLKKILKNPKVTGRLAFWTGNLLKSTLRIKKDFHPLYKNNQQYLFAFWHGKQLLPVLQLMNHNTLRAALVSPSRDGELLKSWLTKLKYEVVSGSARDGSIRSTIALIKKLKSGYSVGFGVDGPIGPIYKVKQGITYMAQKCNIPIVPVGSASAEKWILKKAWDRYEIPKPFTKVGFYIGKPFVVSKDMDLEEATAELERLLHEAENKASEMINAVY